MGKAGRPFDAAVRERVRALLAKGISYSEIARRLGKHERAVRRHVRALGIPAKVYGRMIVRADGKKKCGRCGKWKTPGAFPTERDTVCRMCYKHDPVRLRRTG